MESAFAIQGKDFVLMVQETTIINSIFKLKEKQEKFVQLDTSTVLGLTGDLADQREFSSIVKANLQYQKFKNKRSLSGKESANFIRDSLAKSLRSRDGAKQTDCLLGTCDSKGPQLYWIDYLGTMQKVPYAGHGYASYFVSSVIANSYRNDLTIEETIQIGKDCVFELRKRFLASQDHFSVKIVSQKGVQTIEI